MSYWKYQTVADVAAAAVIAAVVWVAPQVGVPAVLRVDADGVALAARTWLAPALTLLGMMSATTAFIFTVVDRAEFTILRKSKSEAQLWCVFSQNLLWLGIAALYCVIATFWTSRWFEAVAILGTFLIAMTSISVAKFVWIMRQIISVRMARGKEGKAG